VSTPRGKLSAFSSFFKFGDDDTPIPSGTPARAKQLENKIIFDDFMRQAAVASAAVAASEIKFESLQDATEARELLTDLLEAQAETTDNDDVFQALEDLNARVVDALPNSDSDLPAIKKITLENTTPALIIAYDLFENFESEQDIIDRNKIRHPGFIIGGTELEVVDV